MTRAPLKCSQCGRIVAGTLHADGTLSPIGITSCPDCESDDFETLSVEFDDAPAPGVG